MYTGSRADGAGRIRPGFTLTEASLAIVVVGVGFLALMQLFAACTRQNSAAADLSTAALLASNVREAMQGLSFNDPIYTTAHFGPEAGETLQNFDDVDDFDGQALCPPIDAVRRPLNDLAQYQQIISVSPAWANRLSPSTDPTDPDPAKNVYTGVVRVTVRIMHRIGNGPFAEVYRTSWLCMDN